MLRPARRDCRPASVWIGGGSGACAGGSQPRPASQRPAAIGVQTSSVHGHGSSLKKCRPRVFNFGACAAYCKFRSFSVATLRSSRRSTAVRER